MRTILSAALAVLLIAGAAVAGPAITITPDFKSAGKEISPDFCGLSFETKMLLPVGGKYFFRADHTELLSLFKSLGVKSLRIGGNSADAPTVDIPNEADLDQLCGFAQAAGVHLIYNLRLKEQTDPNGDIRLVRYLMDHYKPLINSFTIGNEPNVYFSEYDAYRDQWKKFADAIVAAVPEAQLNGPSTTPGKTAWAGQFADEFGAWGHLRLVTQHSYPGGDAQKAPDAAAARLKILSAEMDRSYEKFYRAFVPTVLKHQKRYRLEEANSLFHGGAAGVSNSYASALWALDYIHWWAAHDADGINFHTGNHRVPDETQVPGGYDISYTTPSGLKTHPIAYALKAFTFASAGRTIPIAIQSAEGQINLTAYGVLGTDGAFVLTIVNKESGSEGKAASVTVRAGPDYARGGSIILESPQNDISQVSGTTLGGATLEGNGNWNGNWSPLQARTSGEFELEIPAATAAILRLTKD